MADMSLEPRGGIYQIRNTENGKLYVGSAVHIVQRWREHRSALKRGGHPNRHLQAAWLKYGADVFEFSVLMRCEPRDLIANEQAAFDTLDPEYNIARRAGNTLGTKRTAETRAKISAKAKGGKKPPRSAEYRAKMSVIHKGRMPSAAHMAALQAGRLGRVYTDEDKRRIGELVRRSYETGARTREKSLETRAKLSAALTGRKATADTRAKQSAAQLGKKRGPYRTSPSELVLLERAEAKRKRAEERKAALAQQFSALWADPVWRLAMLERRAEAKAARPPRKMSAEVCQRMSEARRGKKPSAETRQRMSDAHRGVPCSDERREAIRRAKQAKAKQQPSTALAEDT